MYRNILHKFFSCFCPSSIFCAFCALNVSLFCNANSQFGQYTAAFCYRLKYFPAELCWHNRHNKQKHNIIKGSAIENDWETEAVAA